MTVSGATVMVCDDDPAILDLLSYVLTDHGFAVVPVDCGERACDRVKLGGIDLLLLDRMMPGMLGDEVLQAIKTDSTTKALPVVMLTSTDDMSTISHCLKLGAAEFITKPVNLKLLLQVIDRLLARGGRVPVPGAGARNATAPPPQALCELPELASLTHDVVRMGEALAPILLELQRRYEVVVSESPDTVPLREAGVRISEMRILLEELLGIVDPPKES